jgi:hypothetical protein
LLFHSKKNSELKNVANNRYKVNLVWIAITRST